MYLLDFEIPTSFMQNIYVFIFSIFNFQFSKAAISYFYIARIHQQIFYHLIGNFQISQKTDRHLL